MWNPSLLPPQSQSQGQFEMCPPMLPGGPVWSYSILIQRPLKWALTSPPLYKCVKQAQRGQVTHPRSHSMWRSVTQIQPYVTPMSRGREGEGSLLGGFLSAQPMLRLIHSLTQPAFIGHDCVPGEWYTRGPCPPKLMVETGDTTYWQRIKQKSGEHS